MVAAMIRNTIVPTTMPAMEPPDKFVELEDFDGSEKILQTITETGKWQLNRQSL